MNTKSRKKFLGPPNPKDPFQKTNDLLWEISTQVHVAQSIRDQIASNAALARSIIEKEPDHLSSLIHAHEEVLTRICTLLRLSLEHLREDTRKVFDRLFQELSKILVPSIPLSAYSKTAQEVFGQMDQESDEFFNLMLVRYRLDLKNLRKKANAIQKNEAKGLPLHLLAIYEKYPQSKIIQDYRRQFSDFKKHLELAEKEFRKNFQGNFSERWEFFRSAGRYYERAKYFARSLYETKSLIAIDQTFQSPLENGNPMERFREAYLKINHLEFFPQSSSDEIQAHSDAELFYSYVRSLTEKGIVLPKILNIVEWGVGQGKYACYFLTRLALLDLENSTRVTTKKKPFLIYSQVKLFLFASSEQEAKELKKNAGLMKHEKAINIQVLDPGHLPIPKDGIFYGRFHEVFSDYFPSCVLYVNPLGDVFELELAMQLEKETIVRENDYAKGDDKGFYEFLRYPHDFKNCNYLPALLNSITMKAKLNRIDLKKYPFGKEIRKLIQNHRDVLLPVNVAALQFFQKVWVGGMTPYGYAQIFDYGYHVPNPYHHQSFYYTSQVYRRFGAGIAADLSFPLFGLWAKNNKCKTSLFLPEKLIEKITHIPVVDAIPFVPTLSGRSLIRHVSVQDGIFHLSYLRFYKKIEKLAKKQKGKRNQKTFEKWIATLKQSGYLGSGVPIQYIPIAKDHLENLALELDFWVNGVFRSLVGPEPITWLPLQNPLIARALEEAGYDVNAVLFHVHKNPHYAASRVLRIMNP